MSQLIRAFILGLLISALAVTSLSQSQRKQSVADSPEGAEPTRQIEEMPLDQQQAHWLLEQLFERADACDNAIFRIRLQAEISDLLWKYNEPLARIQFQKIIRAISELKTEKETDELEKPQAFDMRYQLRGEVISLINRHDPEWAGMLDDAIGDNSKNSTVLSKASGPIRGARSGPDSIIRSFVPMKPRRLESMTELLNQVDGNNSSADKDSLYYIAFQQAIKQNNYPQAREFSQKINQLSLRSRLESTVRTRSAMAALELHDYEAALGQIRGMSDIPQRASLYVQLIRRLRDKGNASRIAETLGEVEQWLATAEDSPDKVRAMLTIVQTAAKFDLLRSFEIMQTAVTTINRTARHGGFNLPVAILEQSFLLLARADFTRTLQLAQAIEDEEISLQAQLSLGRGLLRQ